MTIIWPEDDTYPEDEYIDDDMWSNYHTDWPTEPDYSWPGLITGEADRGCYDPN